MKIQPEWTPEFLERCNAIEKVLGWRKDTLVRDIIDWIQTTTINDLEDAMRSAYLYIRFEDDVCSVAIGTMFSADINAVILRRDDMTNWDEFIGTRLTFEKLGVCDED